MQFKHLTLPDQNIDGYVPESLELRLPDNTTLPLENQHFLLYIPWQDSYLALVPTHFQSFFKIVLPYLGVRTTDVHTAICMNIMRDFSRDFQRLGVGEKLVGLALMLHDSGWSQLSEAEVAASLGVTGLQLTASALQPKEKHAVEGEKIARQLLLAHQTELNITEADIELICKAVLYHDKPEAVAGMGNAMPLEVQFLVDLDHIWSFTQENFWQDTLRKGVTSETYHQNLQQDLATYFVTELGKKKAQLLLDERAQEIILLKEWKETHATN